MAKAKRDHAILKTFAGNKMLAISKSIQKIKKKKKRCIIITVQNEKKKM